MAVSMAWHNLLVPTASRLELLPGPRQLSVFPLPDTIAKGGKDAILLQSIVVTKMDHW